jgi:hypothetical protein
MLFIFQNAWAVEKTFQLMCKTTQMSMEKIEMGGNKISKNQMDQHEQCPDCCEMHASFEQLTNALNLDNLPINKFFKNSSFEQIYFIFNQPLLPPPIV